MQDALAFAQNEVMRWPEPLARRFGDLVGPTRRTPVGQLVKSLISSRTRDAVSIAAYRRLGQRWPRAQDIADAAPPEIERVISDVTFADRKAAALPAALRMIRAERGDVRLDFLAEWTVPAALAWLERLPGVGRKTAAATLNASTLGMPVFMVDSHVLRVLIRLGFVGRTATPQAASERVTAAASTLGAEGLLQLYARMKRLGQTICTLDEPRCPICPLRFCCPTAKAMDAARPRA